MGSEISSSSTSKRLHNFTMPDGLRWANQRLLRCMKVNSNGEISAVKCRHSSSLSIATTGIDSNVNAKTNHASKLNDFVSIKGKRIEREKLFKDPPLPPPDQHQVPHLSPFRDESNKSSRLRSGVSKVVTPSDKKERVKFSVPLTRQEIEEDFLAFAGRRPSRRPCKRPRRVQKQLDTMFPGLWLTEITADMYKVRETR